MTLTASESARDESPRRPPTPPRARPGSRATGGAAPAGNRHFQALDGLRGIAVLLVLLFHFELGPFRGGFVGVTVFFTLSGFLICSRTLSEVGRTGGFKVLEFFERRVRRLAPAAVVCILAVVLATNVIGTREQHASVSGDGIAALLNVANWRFLLDGTSYTDLFAAPSPLNHFWSLAIEEQFYLVFPVAVWLLLLLPKRLRAMGVALVVSVALGWAGHESSAADSFNRFYYGTDTRMAELLVGVLLALSISYWQLKPPQPAGGRRMAMGGVALAGLAFVFLAATTFRNGAAKFQHGGALFVALATAALIAGGLEGQNAVAKALSVRPLVWVGKVSYGAYLYHWPIVALSGKAWGPLHGTALGVTQLALSLTLAGVSFRYLEAPIQRRRFAGSRRVLLRGWSQALAGVTAVALGLMLFNAPTGSPTYSPAASALSQTASSQPVPPAPTTDSVDRPLRVLVTGDSTSQVMERALAKWGAAHPEKIVVLDLTLPGCPITPADQYRNYQGEQGQDISLCGGWRKTFPPKVAAFKPDVSLVFLSVIEQADQRLYNGAWQNLFDASYRAYQGRSWDELISVLSATGAPVEWASAPYFQFQSDFPWVSDNPERTDALNAMFRELVARHPGVAHLMDYADQFVGQGRPDDTTVRPDGIHMFVSGTDVPNASAMKVAEQWLIPALQQYTPAAKAGAGGSTAPPS